MKSKPKAKKEKLQDVKTGALGIGDSYAYAVRGLVEGAKDKQGSNQSSWLDVPKQSIDAKQCCDRSELKIKESK